MNKHYAKLKKEFPEYNPVKIITLSEEGIEQLGFKACWVYSCLMYRFTRAYPVSLRELAEYTGIHRTTTLPKIIQLLRNNGLVAKIKNKDKWRFIFPSDEKQIALFNWSNQKATSTEAALSYNWAIYPEAIPKKIMILDWFIMAQDCLNKRGIRTLAKWYGLSRNTVAAARKRIYPETKHRIDPPQSFNYNPVEVQKCSTVEQRTDMSIASEKVKLADQLINYYEIQDIEAQKYVRIFIKLAKCYLDRRQIGTTLKALIKKVGVGEELADYLHVRENMVRLIETA